MTRPDLIYRSALLDGSGYADESRSFVVELLRRGYRVRAEHLGRPDPAILSPGDQDSWRRLAETEVDPENTVHITAVPPGSAQRPPGARLAVLRTMFETERLPRDWVERCNQFDAVWVPSAHSYEAFSAAGVARGKLLVVPGGVDVERFCPGLQPLPLAGRKGCVFLSVLDWQFRKGWDCLLAAFLQAFGAHDDVALYLKVSRLARPTVAASELACYLRTVLQVPLERTPTIVLLAGPLSQAEMPRLYAAADAFVLPSRGEGYGRPYLEAMACGLPVIGTAWGGQTDFLTVQTGYPVRSRGLRPVSPYEPAEVYRGQRWADPDVHHLQAILRFIAANKQAACRKGLQARQLVVDQRSLATVTNQLEQALDHLLNGRR